MPIQSSQKIVAVIPARGGSKRVQNKNIIPLPHGASSSIARPLLQFTITAAKKVKEISEVWVSTDDAAIAACAREYGALVIDRPKELALDNSSSESALLHFAENVNFDVMVFIQATSPLLSDRDLRNGLNLYSTGQFDSVFSAVRETGFFWTKDNRPVNYDPMNRPRSQDKEPWFKENGAYYITSREQLKLSKCRFSGRIGFSEMPLIRSFEIDSWEDVHLVSALMLTSDIDN